MTLKEIINLQKNFDNKHVSSFKWDEIITDDNIHLLEYLLICLVGEFGETSNIIKKVIRGDKRLNDVKESISEEIVDMFIYIIKMGYQLNIDIEEEYLKKLHRNDMRFNNYELKEETKNDN